MLAEPGIVDDQTLTKREALPVTFADISRAMVTIRNGVKKTTCEKSYFLSELIGANVFLKTEFRQFTGSFKERGARNALLYHLRSKGDNFRTKGAIAASAGNHALGLAYHGKKPPAHTCSFAIFLNVMGILSVSSKGCCSEFLLLLSCLELLLLRKLINAAYVTFSTF
jgi:hypothetical protein